MTTLFGHPRIQQFYLECLYHAPIYAKVLQRLKIVITPNIPLGSLSATNGVHVLVHPRLFKDYTYDDMKFVLMHEMDHVLLHHVIRGQKVPYPRLYNIAADVLINHRIVEEENVKVSPELWDSIVNNATIKQYLKPQYQHMRFNFRIHSVEEVYHCLEEPCGESSSCKQSSAADAASKSTDSGTGENQEGDNTEFTDGAGSGASDNDVQQQEKPSSIINDLLEPHSDAETVARQIEQDIRAALQRRGTLPGSQTLQHWLQDLFKQRTHWIAALRRFLAPYHHREPQWSQPSRRFIPYIPKRARVYEFLRAAVMIDSSGSCVDLLPQFGSALTKLLNQYKVTFDLAVVDTIVQMELNNQTQKLPLTLLGGGGTDLRVGFEHFIQRYRKDHARYAVMIVFTDGITPWPQQPPPFPVFVVFPSKSLMDEASCPSWAQTFYLSIN